MAVLWWAEEDLPDFVKEACSAPAMTRIRKIDMNCGMNYTSFPIFAGIAPYTRFEHSLGVGCITWKLTENPAAALAGLFHDIAAPAFSHTVDFARGDYAKQEATEDRTAELIRRDPEGALRTWPFGVGCLSRFEVQGCRLQRTGPMCRPA
jgi:HD superfamily phosphohydrolase